MTRNNSVLNDNDRARQNHERMKSLLASEESKVNDNIIPEEELPTEEVETLELPTNQQGEPSLAKLSDLSGLDFKSILAQLTPTARIPFQTILDYIDAMDPRKPMDHEEGSRHQVKFWHALKVMFNSVNDQDFNIMYKNVLLLFNYHQNDVFKEESVYRFAEYWNMPEEDRNAFRRLINLMLVTRNPPTRRAALKEIKAWKYILAYGLTEQAKRRIYNFYEI